MKPTRRNMLNGDGERALEIEGVTVNYGALLAIDQVSLDVASGETVAVIGPSGSGKSTLLRVVAGLEAPSDGQIRLGGRPMSGVPTHRRDLGLMFQDDVLFPHMAVGANVGFGLRMAGWDRKRRRGRVGQLLSLVGLEGFERRLVHELSGGEAQRVALARALAPEPGLLMLDEPFGSLDQVLRRQLTDELRRLLGELGQSALHVTHDQEEAFAIADRVALINQGRLEQVDTPERLWRSPASRFVAEFIGHPNLWLINVSASGQGYWGDNLVGVFDRWQPGAYEVVVPVEAIRISPTQAQPGLDEAPSLGNGQRLMELVVRHCRWAQGRYWVEAVPKNRPADNEQLVCFESEFRLDTGCTLYVSVDCEKIQRLS